MAYEIRVHPEAQVQVDALPHAGALAFQELITFLQVTPWSGNPANREYPERPLRTASFGNGVGLATYLVLERQQLVDVVRVQWIDLNTHE